MTEIGSRARRAHGRRGARYGVVACLAVAAAAWGCQGAVSPEPAACRIPASVAAAGNKIIEVRGYAYSPEVVQVSPGQTVTWVNCEGPDADQHTATADSGSWSSQYFGAGEYVSKTFDTEGTFAYHCEPHPLMKGTVQVE